MRSARIAVLLVSLAAVAAHAAPPSPIGQSRVADGVTVSIYAHAIRTHDGTIFAWTYVTSGLDRHHQRELTLTIVRKDGEREDAYPRDPLMLFKTIAKLAADGRVVTAFDETSWTDVGLAGDARARAVTYVPSDTSVPHAPDALAMVVLVGEERAALEEFGAWRVVARLVQRTRYWPYPFWFERGRDEIFTAAMRKESIVGRTAHVLIPGVTVVRANERVVLHLPRAQRDRLAEAAKSGGALALAAELDPTADACLVWDREHPDGPTAVGATGSLQRRTCGSFILWFADPKGRSEKLTILEDGFFVMLSAGNAKKLADAIANARDVTLPASPERLEIVVEWRD
jgi:hypothetical protein